MHLLYLVIVLMGLLGVPYVAHAAAAATGAAPALRPADGGASGMATGVQLGTLAYASAVGPRLQGASENERTRISEPHGNTHLRPSHNDPH